jgi:hypothetical protein
LDEKLGIADVRLRGAVYPRGIALPLGGTGERAGDKYKPTGLRRISPGQGLAVSGPAIDGGVSAAGADDRAPQLFLTGIKRRGGFVRPRR